MKRDPTISPSWPGTRSEPTLTHGAWSATAELKWVGKVLHQKLKRRVKRDWGRGCISRTMEYDWKPVPVETSK